MVYRNSDATYNTAVSVNNTYVVLRNSQDRSMFSGYVTIQYTKTTDTAISIGEATEYSTEEKVVGTWIDGKPVYEITLTGATPVMCPSSRTELWFYKDVFPTDIETICNFNGYIKLEVSSKFPSDIGKDTCYIPLSFNDSPNANFIIDSYIYVDNIDNKLGLRVFCSQTTQWFAFSPTITLQYTKKTP